MFKKQTCALTMTGRNKVQLYNNIYLLHKFISILIKSKNYFYSYNIYYIYI